MNEEEKEAIKYLEFLSNEKCECEACQRAKKEYKTILNLLDKQKNEIEEKTTILLAGAEKVKELEKGNRSLMESRIKWKNRYYKERAKNKERDKYNITTLPFEELKEMIEQNKNISIFGKDYISKDKIREKIKELEEKSDYWNCDEIQVLQELLEGN